MNQQTLDLRLAGRAAQEREEARWRHAAHEAATALPVGEEAACLVP